MEDEKQREAQTTSSSAGEAPIAPYAGSFVGRKYIWNMKKREPNAIQCDPVFPIRTGRFIIWTTVLKCDEVECLSPYQPRLEFSYDRH
jgi:hypothetical protein